MRALSSLLLAGAIGFGGSVLMPATAEADGGWRGRDYYRNYVPAPSYGYGYLPPPAYYRPPPPVYYRRPPAVFYRPPPAYVVPAPGFYGYGVPRSYGIPPGPGVGLWRR